MSYVGVDCSVDAPSQSKKVDMMSVLQEKESAR